MPDQLRADFLRCYGASWIDNNPNSDLCCNDSENDIDGDGY